MRLRRSLALVAWLAVSSCTLNFDRFEGSASPAQDGSTDATGGDSDGFAGNSDGFTDVGAEAAAVDASSSSSGGPLSDSGSGKDAADSAADARTGDGSLPTDAAMDGGDITSGLVAYYKFDEASGTTAADSSGNGNTATLAGGATFSTGTAGNALTLSGTSQYAILPSGVVGGFTAYSVAAWVNPSATPSWSRIFDFGSGTTSYMFLTPNSGTTFRFAITTGGNTAEQQLNANQLATMVWQHVAVTFGSNNTGTLYVNGAVVARSTNMTLTPSSLGTTTQRWIGRSEYASDPYFSGQIDNLRIYSRTLAPADVQALAAGHL